MIDAMKTMRATLFGLAIAAAPIAANAVTVTVSDAAGTTYAYGLTYSVDTTLPTNEYLVEIDQFFGDGTGTYSFSFDFLNNTLNDAFLSVATLLDAGDFNNESLVVTGAGVGGAPVSISLDGEDNFITVLAGSTATFTATYDALNTRGNFDFSVAAVPVPAAGLMLLTALGGLGMARRRRKDA